MAKTIKGPEDQDEGEEQESISATSRISWARAKTIHPPEPGSRRPFYETCMIWKQVTTRTVWVRDPNQDLNQGKKMKKGMEIVWEVWTLLDPDPEELDVIKIETKLPNDDLGILSTSLRER